MKKKTGIIYKATCLVNGKVYIGQTINSLKLRRSAHISNAFNVNSHNYNTKFKQAIRKYGSENFNWEVLYDNVHIDILNPMERQIVSQYNSYNKGYNATEGGDSIPKNLIRKNIKFSKKHRKKLSLALSGRKLSKEHRKNLSIVKTGRKHSAQIKANMSKSKIGLPSPMKGKKHSNNTKAKISKKMNGENHPLYGIGHSKETKEKMSKIHSSGIDKGENNGNARLTLEKVSEIRLKYATGNYTQLQLSKEYDVSRAHIGHIVNNKAWIKS